MPPSLTDLLSALGRSRGLLDEALRQAPAPGPRAAAVAAALRALWPGAPLYFCGLHATGQGHAAALDAVGTLRPDWAATLQGRLAQGGPALEGGPHGLAEIPEGLDAPGILLAVAPIAFAGRAQGALAAGVAQGEPAEAAGALQALLAACSAHLALRLGQEAASGDDADHLAWMADLAELAGPLAHQVNNFLNVALLQVAILESELPERLRPELAELRRHGKATAALVQHWQQYRRAPQPVPPAADLNGEVRAAAEQALDKSSGVPALELALAPDLPAVAGFPSDVRRLCFFLVKNAAAAAGAEGRVTVRTGSQQGLVVLRVEDTGPDVSPELAADVFEPQAEGRPGTDGLELAACQRLARRLGGTIRFEGLPQKGAAVTVELAAADA